MSNITPLRTFIRLIKAGFDKRLKKGADAVAKNVKTAIGTKKETFTFAALPEAKLDAPIKQWLSPFLLRS